MQHHTDPDEPDPELEADVDVDAEPGLLDGVKFWIRLLAEVVAIGTGSLLAFVIARPIWVAITGTADAGAGLALSWLILTFGVIVWYKRRRLAIGY